MVNPYRPTRAVIREVVPETGTIKTFVLEPEVPMPFQAGQFMELTVPAVGEAPFTPSSSPREARRIALTVMKAGTVTGALHALEPGSEVGLRGPFGNAYPLDEFAGRDVLLLGGGVGMAPLRSLLLALVEQKERFGRILLCYGARTPSDLVYRQQLDRWRTEDGVEVHLTVDRAEDGWTGRVGVVTEVLDEVQVDPSEAVAVVCGPPVMMKFGTLALAQMGFPPESIYLSMERNMSCGIGKCGHCRLGPYYVCRDGPVFTYAQLHEVHRLW